MKCTPVRSAVRICLLGLLVALVWTSPVFSAEPVEVTAGQVKDMMDANRAFVVFPLSPIEYNNLHIEGSVNIPIAKFPAGLPEDKNRALVFYCLGRT